MLVIVGVWGADAQSDYADLPKWQPKTKKIVVFKNGIGFVMKEGKASLKEGWVQTEELPSAVMGSMWFDTANQKNPIAEVIAYKDTTPEELDARSPIELIEANPGQKATVTYSLGNTTRTVEGTLIKRPRPPSGEASDTTNEAIYRSYNSFAHARVPEQTGDLVLLRTETNGQSSILGINRNSILTVELPGDAQMRVTREKQVSRARIRVGGDPVAAELSMSYLTKGLTWSPSYRIDISDEKKAEVVLDAVLMNDIESLENTEVLFAVGFPNFLHADVISPLSLGQGVAAFIQSLHDGRGSVARSRLTSQAFHNFASFDPGQSLESAYATAKPMPGEQNEDLYFYRQQKVSIKKGDRASYPVSRATVPYEHAYQWRVPESMNVDERGHRRSSETPSGSENHVWHVLRLENTTKQPWTTASAFTTKAGLPIAQDTLRYTPPGGSSTLQLTVATDIRARQSHKETARRSVTIEGRTYEEVTVEGKLTVINWKDKKAKMLVQQTVVGEVMGDTGGKLSKVARAIAALNPTSELEWEFVIEPGKQKELGYTYKVLINR